VELVEKRLDSSTGRQIGWTLTTKELIDVGNGVVRATWNKEVREIMFLYTKSGNGGLRSFILFYFILLKVFDAVVVATGRYNAPNIPNVQGLEKWAKEFPKGYSHSRQYRRPQVFAGKTILMVGAAVRFISLFWIVIYNEVFIVLIDEWRRDFQRNHCTCCSSLPIRKSKLCSNLLQVETIELNIISFSPAKVSLKLSFRHDQHQ